MDIRCTGCKALHWAVEALKESRDGEAGFKCHYKSGQLDIEPICQLLETIKTLKCGNNNKTQKFWEWLQRWNSILVLTRMRFNMDSQASEIGGSSSFIHLTNPLI